MISEEEQLHRCVLDRFLFVRHVLTRAATRGEQVALGVEKSTPKAVTYSVNPMGKKGTGNEEILAAVVPRLAAAHIFEFAEPLFIDLFVAVDKYVCWLTGHEYDTAPETGDDAFRFYKGVTDAAKQVPFPERLPFDSVYLGWGAGVRIGAVNRRLYGVESAAEDLVTVGHLVAPDLVAELMTNGKQAYVISHWEKDTQSWASGYSLMPWLIVAIIGAINANVTLVKERPRSLWDRTFAKKHHAMLIGGTAIPPLYYSVQIRPAVVAEQLRREQAAAHIERSHRWDRRGHFRHRFMRGKLHELTDKLREDLTERQYKILVGGLPLDAEATTILSEHGHLPPRVGEFVALLRYWTRDTICGPLDKPYVPSSRRLASGAKRPRVAR